MDSRGRKLYTKALEAKYFLGAYHICDEAQLLSVDAERAFWHGAFVASILAAQAAIESYLRYHYASVSARLGFYDLIEYGSSNGYLTSGQAGRLHSLRRLRNQWVHASDPADDRALFVDVEELRSEQEERAKEVIELMFEILFIDPGV